ncbi:MAG: hypothetical protein V1740_05420 [Candidatus Woesearchaeota archaeon]
MKIQELNKAYDTCIADGVIREVKEADLERAKTMLALAEKDIADLKTILSSIEKKKNYTLLWRNFYEIVMQLVDGILLTEKIRSDNHQCLFAYICTKHPEWEIDWNTMETMRLLRNGAQYQGIPVKEEIWKEYKLKFDIYISTFKKILEEKLEKSK